MSEEKCCVVTCDLPLDQTYWNNQYQANATGWDLGQVSPPIKTYIDTIENKEVKILIPGCGNAYEAEYLIQQGLHILTEVHLVLVTLILKVTLLMGMEIIMQTITSWYLSESTL
jgi:hypothetical protein